MVRASPGRAKTKAAPKGKASIPKRHTTRRIGESQARFKPPVTGYASAYATKDELRQLRFEFSALQQMASALEVQKRIVAQQHEEIAYLLNKRRAMLHSIIETSEKHFIIQCGGDVFLLQTPIFQFILEVTGESFPPFAIEDTGTEYCVSIDLTRIGTYCLSWIVSDISSLSEKHLEWSPYVRTTARPGHLPSCGEQRHAPERRPYFIDHNTRTTTWVDPFLQQCIRIYSGQNANNSTIPQQPVSNDEGFLLRFYSTFHAGVHPSIS